MRIRSFAVAALLVLSGCSAQAPAAPLTVLTDPATASPAAAADAGAVVKQLATAGLGLTNTAVQDENTDPNNLLGRPNGYLSRASADLPGGNRDADKGGIDRGLVAEGFAGGAAAKARSEHIQGLLKGSPILGTEWHYFANAGRVLVRVSGNVKPSLAKKMEAAVAQL